MNRRIIGGESGNTQWYRKWHARYHCRQWQLDHEGQMPEKVELVKVWYAIPPPEETAIKGYYVPEDLLERTGHEKIEHTERCRGTVMGQLPNYVRERHGLPPLPETTPYKPWIKHKVRAWERKLAKERGEEPVDDAEARRKKAAEANARAKAERAEQREEEAPEQAPESVPEPERGPE
jgi:hypothetical protein